MRFPSGTTDQYLYFVAVDATDLKTRETGLSSFTVYRSRNGGAASSMTTPTINEVDATNMPGVYELLLDEDMTIDAGDDSQEMVFHVTHAGMAPVTRSIELYRPKITAGNTLGVASDGDLVKVNTLDGHTAQTGDTFAQLPTNFSSLGIEVDGDVTKVNALDGHTAQTGDTFSQLPTNFSSLGIESDGDVTKVNTLDGHTAQTGDSYPIVSSVTHGNAALKTLIDTIDSVVDQVLSDTGTDGVVLSSATQQAIATALLDLANGVESDMTIRETMRVMLAAMAGKVAGADTSTITFRDTKDQKDRITATVDGNGNRTAVTTDPS